MSTHETQPLAESGDTAKACPNDESARCGCKPFGGICPALASPEVAELALVLAPTTGRAAAVRYAKQVIAAGYSRVSNPPESPRPADDEKDHTHNAKETR